ncbi:MAG: hypothetical protein FK733_17765 [Asgard group archaeon]|nr:hypothetical protein [Asgard group archaeon]
MFKKKHTSIILAIILFTSISVVFGNVKVFNPVTTGITNLNWSHHNSSESLNEDYSYFNFIIDYNIFNPNKNPIVYDLAYCNLAFLPNISISFDNETIEYIPPHYIGLCALGNKTVYPGITEEIGYCSLTIKTKGLTDLPNGRYTLWVYLRDHPEVIANTTLMIIADDKTSIYYNTSQTLGLDIPFANIMIITSIISVSLVYFYKKKKGKQNN